VSAGERELDFWCFASVKLEVLNVTAGVALFATVAPRSGRELPLMFVLVTIHAKGKTDLVARRLSGRSMAVGAFHLCVRRHQGKPGFGVIQHRISGWNPTLHRVATLASAPIGALQELASVRIWAVAIRTVGEGHGRLEIRALVAGKAGDFQVLSL